MSTVGGTNPVTGSSGTNSSTATNAVGVNESVTQDQFMQLLVTQMENQDPTQPEDDSQMLSQLAQFSSLGQMQQLNQTMSASTQFGQLSQSAGLIGATVTGGTTANPVTGTVSAVTQSGGNVLLTIGNQQIDASTVTAIQ